MATLALGCMPLLPPRLMVAVIAAWLTILVIRAFVDPMPVSWAQVRWCVLLALPFLVMLPDILRAPDVPIGWKHVERSTSLLLFPAGFLLLSAPASRRSRGTMIDLFSISSIVLAVYANIAVAYTDVPAEIRSEAGYAYNYRAVFSSVTSLQSATPSHTSQGCTRRPLSHWKQPCSSSCSCRCLLRS